MFDRLRDASIQFFTRNLNTLSGFIYGLVMKCIHVADIRLEQLT